MNALRLYGRYIGVSIRSQMQYRTSFLLQAVAHFLATGIEFLGLSALFSRFRQIDGWSLAEVGMFYGMISIAFAIAEAVPRGFDEVGYLIRRGELDQMLLRPRPVAYQVLGYRLQLMRVGGLSQGVIVLLWSTHTLAMAWTWPKLVLLAFAIVGGAALFSGLFILQAAICFWTIESIEIVNCATYGGVETGQYPLSIYRPWFRRFFTFVVPLATINYFPIHAILGRSDPLGSSLLLQCLSPLAGVAFLAASLLVWQVGLRRYASAGGC